MVSCSIEQQLSLPTDFQMCIVASFYNYFGDGRTALNILKGLGVHEKSPKRVRVWYHTQKTWALLNSNKLDDAKHEFEQAKRVISETGMLLDLLRGEILEGLVDEADGELDSAIDAFTRAYESLEEKPAPMDFKNVCLLHLTDIEIERYNSDSPDNDEGVSGPWMQRLEEQIKRNDLPGIEAWFKILKAKFYRKQGQEDEVKLILNDALVAANSSSMRYLKDIVKDTFPDY